MENNGYNFFFALPNALDDGEINASELLITFPITPSELTISCGSKNETVTLIDEGDINILKSPSLTEVEFEARFPMRQYPYARQFIGFEEGYKKTFDDLRESKKPFRFIVTRTTPDNKRTWDTNLLMALEDMTFKESADEGDDVLIKFKLKQYKDYSVRTLENQIKPRNDGNKADTQKTYVVQEGDTLYLIAKKMYNDGSKWTGIYHANKNIIEETANKYRNGKGSSNGRYIYRGTVLVIPPSSTIASTKSATTTTNKTKSNTTSTTNTTKATNTNVTVPSNTVVTPTTNEATITVTVPDKYKDYFSVQIYKSSNATPWGSKATTTAKIGHIVVVKWKEEKKSYSQLDPGIGIYDVGKLGQKYAVTSLVVNGKSQTAPTSGQLTITVSEKTYNIKLGVLPVTVQTENTCSLEVRTGGNKDKSVTLNAEYTTLVVNTGKSIVTADSTKLTGNNGYWVKTCIYNTPAKLIIKPNANTKIKVVCVLGSYTYTKADDGTLTYNFNMNRNASVRLELGN